MTFNDHFSGHSDIYAKYRPNYPKELFDFLAKESLAHQLAWDCATGTGQVAIALTTYFDQIFATDASENQIRNARTHKQVQYQVAPAESSGLADSSCDLITVGQALHWFNFEQFYKEVERVSKPGCVLAAWSYGLHNITDELDVVIGKYYDEIVDPYWPPERDHVDSRYRNIPFPFEQIDHPPFVMKLEYDLDGYLGYLSTWSATQRYIKEKGQNPLDLIREEMALAWGDANLSRNVCFPMFGKFGRL